MYHTYSQSKTNFKMHKAFFVSMRKSMLLIIHCDNWKCEPGDTILAVYYNIVTASNNDK